MFEIFDFFMTKVYKISFFFRLKYILVNRSSQSLKKEHDNHTFVLFKGQNFDKIANITMSTCGRYEFANE